MDRDPREEEEKEVGRRGTLRSAMSPVSGSRHHNRESDLDAIEEIPASSENDRRHQEDDDGHDHGHDHDHAEDEAQKSDWYTTTTTPKPSIAEKTEAEPAESQRNTRAEAATEAEPGTATETVTGEFHSAFTRNTKLFIVTMISMASFFSPLSGQIYYPVMPTLVQNYHLSSALINLTITTYLILQGLAPSFMGTFADQCGRRPAYILAFAIYTAANFGLAFQNSYAALLVLRCLQSAGSSGTVAFGYGVVADIATPAERGRYIGPMAAGVMVAPAVGPVIGGLLARFLGWRSVFWFLVVISGGYLVVFVVTMPETGRRIVGNGSVLPREWWRVSVVQYVKERVRVRRMSAQERSLLEEEKESSKMNRTTTRLTFPNPLKSFAILLEKDALIIILYVGLVMFANIALLTSTPNLFGDLYGFNELEIGLCFLLVADFPFPL